MAKNYVKGRDWTFIVYPESAPENWRQILDDTHQEWIESPLHDKDVNPDGTPKKPHWHILLHFPGPATIKMVKEVIAPLHTPIPMKVGSTKGLVRYMAHLDNPEKYQYAIDDIKPHNGADIQDYFKLTVTESLKAMKEIFEVIKQKKFDNYIDFLSFCIEQGNDDWFDIAINRNTLAINKMLDSMYQKNKIQAEREEEKLRQVKIDRMIAEGKKEAEEMDKAMKAKKLAKQGLTKTEIADKLGISRQMVYKYLKK